MCVLIVGIVNRAGATNGATDGVFVGVNVFTRQVIVFFWNPEWLVDGGHGACAIWQANLESFVTGNVDNDAGIVLHGIIGTRQNMITLGQCTPFWVLAKDARLHKD